MTVAPAKKKRAGVSGRERRRIHSWEEGLAQVRAAALAAPTAGPKQRTSAPESADPGRLPPDYYYG